MLPFYKRLGLEYVPDRRDLRARRARQGKENPVDRVHSNARHVQSAHAAFPWQMKVWHSAENCPA